jgi:hypothetical protein
MCSSFSPLFGSENWTIKAGDATIIRAGEIKYMRRTARYIWIIIKQIQRLQRN